MAARLRPQREEEQLGEDQPSRQGNSLAHASEAGTRSLHVWSWLSLQREEWGPCPEGKGSWERDRAGVPSARRIGILWGTLRRCLDVGSGLEVGLRVPWADGWCQKAGAGTVR